MIGLKTASMSLLRGVALMALLTLSVPMASALAQDAGSNGSKGDQNATQNQKKDKNTPPAIPAAVLSGLLTGTPQSMLALKQYLGDVSTSPDEVTKRALHVVQQLKNSGLVKDPALLAAAAERVTQSVHDTLNSAKIVQLKIDRNFIPPKGAIALAFAPADTKAPPGFKHVLPTDPIISGKKLQAVRRPGQSGTVLDSGIAGVHNISLNVPDGEYRVTLMTDANSDAATSLAPFGQSIVANGQSINVMQSTPDNWLKQAVLSNQGLAGFQDATGNQGGAVTITVKVTNGKLDLGLNTGDTGEALQTYLSGMIVEPVSDTPLITPQSDVASLLAPQTDQSRYESQVASSIASVLESVNPASGQQNNQNSQSNNNQNNNDASKPAQQAQQASPS